jgi:23S rRNA (cytosine1962-C5)-methyltransferase
MAGLIVKPRSRIFHGHDWVHGSEILKTFGNPVDGDVVGIKDGKDRFLGSALYNARSRIPVRRFSRHRQVLDHEFFVGRLQRAVAFRDSLGFPPGRPRRLVWSESDGLPGVILDLYGTVGVLQTLTLGMDLRKQDLVRAILEVCPFLTSLIERNDSSGRALEGLSNEKSLLHGEEPGPQTFTHHGVDFEVDLWSGHKTGFYLDQLESYPAVAKWAHGRHVLDCFSNQGGFALACAKAGAASVTAVESGEEACDRLRGNTKRNAVDSLCDFHVERRDVFEFLRRAAKGPKRWDLIVLDPPSFAKGRGEMGSAEKGYRELHVRAAGLLNHGGLIATFTCSHHMAGGAFASAVSEGFSDGGHDMRLREMYSQAPDHPVLMHMPETRYFEGMLVELLATHRR